jgi:PAS domain S-box-containing protein
MWGVAAGARERQVLTDTGRRDYGVDGEEGARKARRAPAGADAKAARNLRLELVLEATGLGDWSWDAASDLITLSPRASELFGVPVGLRMSWADMHARLHPDDAAKAQTEVEAALRGEPCQFECRVERQDGSEGWVLARGRALKDKAGEVVAMLGVVSDVTQAKVLEAQHRESEARFRIMADSAPASVWMTAPEGQIEFVNQAFSDFAGLPREALLGDAWIALMHSDDRAEVGRIREAARKGPDPYTFEARFRSPDGEWRVMRASSKPRFDERGVFRGYVGLAVDVTEMRAAERAARESERRFRLVADDAPVMLWMCDRQGKLLYVNRRLREFMGGPEEIAELDWDQILSARGRARLRDAFRGAMEAGVPHEVEGAFRRPSGEQRVMLSRATPRVEADGQVVGMIGVMVDITDVRRAETHQRLLINELNHRVKNTLATVQSVVRQTVRGEGSVAEIRETLTARLLALSAAHDVLTRENWEGAGLREVVDQAVRHYEPTGAPRFVVTGPPVRLPPKVALAISMALHELATNAVKHGALSCEGGRVEIGWSPGAAGEEAGLVLEWRERDGPPVSPPKSTGFGSRLLKHGLAIEMGWPAELIFAPEGLKAILRARLD